MIELRNLEAQKSDAVQGVMISDGKLHFKKGRRPFSDAV